MTLGVEITVLKVWVVANGWKCVYIDPAMCRNDGAQIFIELIRIDSWRQILGENKISLGVVGKWHHYHGYTSMRSLALYS